jgi:hypothetical protein
MSLTFEELREMGCPNELLIQYYLSPELLPEEILSCQKREETENIRRESVK